MRHNAQQSDNNNIVVMQKSHAMSSNQAELQKSARSSY